MFGRLHIEQCLLIVQDQFVDGSGFKGILEACSVATIDVSAAVDVNQIKRSLYCAQVLLCSLYRKLAEAAKTGNSLLEPYECL